MSTDGYRKESDRGGAGRAGAPGAGPRRASVDQRRGERMSPSREPSRSAEFGRTRDGGARRPSSAEQKPKEQGGTKALTRRERNEIRRAEKEREWSESVERVRSGHDWVFFIIVMLLVSIGTVMVYSASYPSALADGLGGFYYVGRQLFWILIGLVAMFVMSYTPSELIKKAAPALYVLTFFLLAAVLVVGYSTHGAKRWIGSGQIRIQPSEIAKFAIVAILAWYVSRNEDKIKHSETRKGRFIYGVLIPSAFIFLFAVMVILEKHLSGTLIIVAIGVILMFLAGADWKFTIPYYLGIGGVGALFYVIKNPYALKRIMTFTDENADILSEKWQTYQGTLAIGSGGFAGLGLGQSKQKFSYVSEAQNDFIFTIWCEEMGFIGAVVIIALFIALIIRGYRIALRAPDTFSSLIVFGIITQVGLQAFLNLMVVTDVIPNTGISLPFLSYGGSSLVMLMAEMGIVL
ncbi:MAG: putative lipid II flippase FtsW, partial [Clostridia bacterium]|nr:putative lipid II flippase FtsW [Clostridia bacterium]